MAYRKWTDDQKAEAVALASVMGAEAAARQLGMDGRAVRAWSQRAGVDPADTIDVATWADLERVALARTMAAITAPGAKPAQVATVAAIAKRNAEKPRSEAVERAIDARDAFLDWCVDEVVTDADLADFDAVDDALARLPGHLLRRADAEHRPAILAWFSGNPEREAGDVLEWAKAQTLLIGSLIAWRALEVRRVEREGVIRARAEALVREAGMRSHEAGPFVRANLVDDFPDPYEVTP